MFRDMSRTSLVTDDFCVTMIVVCVIVCVIDGCINLHRFASNSTSAKAGNALDTTVTSTTSKA